MATQKKIAAKKSAPKAKKASKKAEPVSTAWNAGQTMTLHGCKVGGKVYKSVWAAFQALGMGEKSGVSRGQHIRFRKELKKAGVGKSATYTVPEGVPKLGGKKFVFTLVKPATPA